MQAIVVVAAGIIIEVEIMVVEVTEVGFVFGFKMEDYATFVSMDDFEDVEEFIFVEAWRDTKTMSVAVIEY